ncbi:hypothetical protein JCM1840_002828 [Sporobolomyces johnsonii]
MWPFTSAPSPSDPAPPSACPVDHSTREQWLAQNPDARPPHPSPSSSSSEALPPRLSTEREVSSIPRWLPPSPSSSPSASADSSSPAPPSSSAEPPSACPAHSANVSPPSSVEQAATVPSESNWVYPSPASFYAALERKQRNPNPKDMGIVVPIHNAVNERVWAQVLDWERRAMGLPEGEETGVKLVSFIGRPKDVSPRARWKTLIGYTAPFDRHDWIVDRPVRPPSSSPSPSPSSTPPTESEPESIRIRYVIDFYTGRGAGLLTPPAPSPAPEDNFRPNLAFFIDCRPALDGFEGVRMRWSRWLEDRWGVGAGAAAPRTAAGQ